MNKNLKKLIATLSILGIFSTIAPKTDLNLMITKAYADETDGITSLKMKDSDGDTMDLYDDNDYKSKNEIDDDELKSGKTYYAETSLNKVEINVKGVDSENVRVFKGDSSDSDEGDKPGDSVRLSSDKTTTIIVRVYNEDPGDVEYSDDSYISEYKIKVENIDSDDDDDDDEYDNVYLESIYLSAGAISFAKRTYVYDASVDEDIDEVEIKARPDCDNDEYDNYKVKINGIKVDKDDKFKDEVSLNKGKNVIEIKVEDDEDNERIYTLNITRGKSADNNSSNNSQNNNESLTKTNQWVQVNGRWQYNDATGNSVKNTWIQNYFVQADGNMAIGWLSNNGSWYYLGIDGARKTGWQSVNGIWYYLDSQGKMQTGWMKDINEKYYYLNSDGSMAYNTTIDGYKLGTSGAWTLK